MNPIRRLVMLPLALLPLVLLTGCPSQGPGGGTAYRFAFDDTSNREAFRQMPDAVTVRGRLTFQGNPPPSPPQVRLQFRYVAEDGSRGPWQDGPTLQLTPDQEGYLAQANLENIWPVGLDLEELQRRGFVQLRALVGNQELALSERYQLLRINPLWVKVYPEPSLFWAVEVGEDQVCAVGRTQGQDPDPLAWCLDHEGQPLHEVRETGPAWGYLGAALAGDGTLYTLPNTGSIRAFRNGSPTGLALTPRGTATAIAVGEGVLYVGGALDLTWGNCSVKRLYVDRYRLPDLGRENSLEFTPEQAQENPTNCTINNSAPALLRVAGGRVYMVYGVNIHAYYSDDDFYAYNRLGIAALGGQDLQVEWLYAPGNPNTFGSCVRGSLCGWALYWGSRDTCAWPRECRALYHALRGFDLDLSPGWLWASMSRDYLSPQDGRPLEGALEYRYQILLGGTRVWFFEANRPDATHLLTFAATFAPGRFWTVVLRQEGGSVEALRRHSDRVYAVGQAGDKGFVARLR